MYKLFAWKGSGSAIIENLLVRSDLPYEIEYLTDEGAVHEKYKAINPLGQFPALQLPSGEIMTESLAIGIYLNKVAKLDLVPENDPKFLRWSVYLVSSLYPTFTYGDYPERYVNGETAGKELRDSTDRYREKLWKIMESAAGSPWFMGDKMSLIDIYLAVMSRWRPRREWFEANTPKLIAAAKRFEDTTGFKSVLKANS